jgi:Glycosyl transferase family 2
VELGADRGQSNAHNNALTKASSRWIAWLNIDEVYLPGVLETLIRHAERTAADVLTATASSSTRTAGSTLAPQHRFSAKILRE